VTRQGQRARQQALRASAQANVRAAEIELEGGGDPQLGENVGIVYPTPRPAHVTPEEVRSAAPLPAFAQAQEVAGASDPGIATSNLRLRHDAREVSVPHVGVNWVCPNCEAEIPPAQILVTGKPARYEHLLNTIYRCPHCRFLFSYRSRAVVIRA